MAPQQRAIAPANRGSPDMDVSATDYTDARQRMVDGQIRPNGIRDPRLLRAMRDIPRERFLPPYLAPIAYIDEDIALGSSPQFGLASGPWWSAPVPAMALPCWPPAAPP
jgi:hypothetical protein